jgi:hypothetical protein
LSIKENALDAVVEYRRAHLNWKLAPDGEAKVKAKVEKGKKHSAMLQAAEIYERQLPIPER